MLDLPLVLYASPTLSGLKSASLFTRSFPTRQEMLVTLLHQNRSLSPKGLHLLPLSYHRNRVCLYLYRPTLLARDLSHPMARALLWQLGYPSSCAACIVHLMKKLRTQDHFPHEIGLFLGYPPEDVCGFMEHGPDCCKCTGCWKVYGDEEAARKKFAQYKKCTRVYCDRWAKGTDIERLTVSTPDG